jgi:putative hydrolase of the HAD superfamily
MATVLIDLDGTLIPLDAWNSVFAEICTYIAKRSGTTPAEVWRRVRRRNLELMRALDLRAFDWQKIFEETAVELGVDEVPDVVQTLKKHLNTFRLNEGAAEALAELKAMGFRVEIATNGLTHYQMPVIQHLGLDRLVDDVRTSDRFRCPKTCPQYFQNARVMIGDNPIFDVYFPRRFGLYTVFYGDWGKTAATYAQRMQIDLSTVTPHATITTLRAIPSVVRRLLNSQTPGT